MKSVRYISVLLFCLFAFMSCRQAASETKALQRVLNTQETLAMQRTELIARYIETKSLDSLYMMDFSDSNTIFYIFDESGLVFWSANWLSINANRLEGYDRWYYQRFENAHTICRWTSVGGYSIVAVIPIKYAFKYENRWLHNTFIPPFKSRDNMDIVPLLTDENMAVYAPDGDYLFSLKDHVASATESARKPNSVPSFSYQNLFADNTSTVQNKAESRLSFWLIICSVVLMLMIVIWAVVQIVRYRGIRNLPLRDKILFWFGLLLIASVVYFGIMSRSAARERYVDVQRRMLRDKCAYLQVALKSKVAYITSFTSEQANDLNIELKDLSLAYETDIHVYDLSGRLVGTSLPEMFDIGLRGKRLAPEPMFRHSDWSSRSGGRDEPLIQYEHIGDMRYMAGYIDCVNWDDIQIGFIGVPFYISESDMQDAVDAMLVKIVPAYFVVLVMLIIFSVLIARALTYPLSELGKRLRSLDPTEKNEKLTYIGHDEVGDLVESYNKMVDDLNRNVMSLTEKEREAAWQTMSRQVAHEIKNPLTPMKLTVQQMQRAKQIGGERFDNYFDKATRLLIDQIDNLSQIAGSFSAFAKNLPDEINLDSVDVAAKLNMSVMMYSNYEGLSIRYIGPESGVMVYADVEQIGRVFTNIIQNAVQAMEEQENKDIIVMLKPDKEWVEISISDNGPGIPDELRDKIFLPNFTTKTTGMGLGLAMCKNIVGRSGGELWFESTEGKGSIFYIKLRIA